MKKLLLLSLLATAVLVRAEDKPAAAEETCIVSGEKLGEMGKPVEYVYKEQGKPDRVLHFCCKMCIGKFKKDPAKYLKKLDEAAAAKK